MIIINTIQRIVRAFVNKSHNDAYKISVLKILTSLNYNSLEIEKKNKRITQPNPLKKFSWK